MTERQAVVATYKHQIVFPLPLGLNIEDKTVVEKWWVKSETLYIKFMTGTKYSSSSEYENIEEIDGITYDNDNKWPDSETIEYFEDRGFDENETTELLDERFMKYTDKSDETEN
jgi:hypothetical protein